MKEKKVNFSVIRKYAYVSSRENIIAYLITHWSKKVGICLIEDSCVNKFNKKLKPTIWYGILAIQIVYCSTCMIFKSIALKFLS